MDRIIEKDNYYLIYYNNRNLKISKKRYGDLTYLLCKKILEDKIRYQDYFEIENNIATFFINTIKFGIIKVYIDKEYVNLFFNRKISISYEKHTNSYYAKTKDGAVHRLVMNALKGEYVDHMNHNTLDNTKTNLRIVNNSLNAKNARIRKDNKTGVRGVYLEKNSYIVFWVDFNGIRKRKSFSINKYGKEIAFKLACDFRKQMEIDNDYLI